jgi:Uma2 family endonuclease
VYLEAPLGAERIDSEPEPDLLVCSNPDMTAYGTARTAPLLVIEVADSSVEYDLGEKAALYAQAGVPEYWVVNLVDRVLEVFQELENGSYQRRSSLELGSRVTPEAWPDLELEVASFFPTIA